MEISSALRHGSWWPLAMVMGERNHKCMRERNQKPLTHAGMLMKNEVIHR